MYFEKLERKDFKYLLDNGIVLDFYKRKLQDYEVIDIDLEDSWADISIKNINSNDIFWISVHDFYIHYCLYPFKFDLSKFYRFMFDKFGRKYIDDLLFYKDIDPNMIKEIYSKKE